MTESCRLVITTCLSRFHVYSAPRGWRSRVLGHVGAMTDNKQWDGRILITRTRKTVPLALRNSMLLNCGFIWAVGPGFI